MSSKHWAPKFEILPTSLLFDLRPQKVSYSKRPFHNQGQSFLYIAIIKSSQVKLSDSTVHACILNTAGNIVQYILYSTMF